MRLNGRESTKVVIFAKIIDYLTTFVAFFFNMSTWTTETNKVAIIVTLIVNFSKGLANNQSTQVEEIFLQNMWHVLPDAWQICSLSALFSTVYNKRVELVVVQ